MQNLINKEKPKTIDTIKSTIVTNLKKMGELKKKGPAKTFKGKESDYHAWVKETCLHIVDINWDRYDDDMDGFLDENEAHNFV